MHAQDVLKCGRGEGGGAGGCLANNLGREWLCVMWLTAGAITHQGSGWIRAAIRIRIHWLVLFVAGLFAAIGTFPDETLALS